MAIGTENYTNTAPTTTDYPHGGIKDNPGNGTGTPINKLTNDDIHQTFRKILTLAGITPNGLPDNVTNGYQYVDAFKAFLKRSNGIVVSSTGLTLTKASVSKLISTEGSSGTTIHTLPNSTLLNEGDSFIFVNNSSFGVGAAAFGSDQINAGGVLGGGFILFQSSDFVELILQKSTNTWYVGNFKTTPTPVVANPVVARKTTVSGITTDYTAKYPTVLTDIDTINNVSTGNITPIVAGNYKVNVGFIYMCATVGSGTFRIKLYKNGGLYLVLNSHKHVQGEEITLNGEYGVDVNGTTDYISVVLATDVSSPTFDVIQSTIIFDKIN